jgi:replicative DNA helicase
LNVAKKGKTVVMFTQEMEAYEVFERIIANQSYVPMDNLIEKFEDIDETTKDIYFSKIINKSNELSKLPIKMIDRTRLTTATIRTECQQFENIGLIIIDYLQLMTPVKSEQNRNLEIAQITRELKILASDLGCPILLLSQLNRVKNETDMPSLNDLRDSGAIEQDLVKSMMLWKTDIENNKIGLVINKNRRGSTGAVEFKFEGKYMMYTELGLYDMKKAKKNKKSDWSDFD